MAANHTANFSESLESFRAVYFVWSAYTGGTVRDYNFNVTSLPVAFVTQHPGVSTIHPVREPDGKDDAKLLYVSATYAKGNAVNDAGDAHDFVLREVWGVS